MPRKNDPAYSTENSVFATRLREIMKERGENQTTLADKITSQYVTIQRQTLSLYMSGQSRPDTERLTAICKTLDVSADWLLGLTDYRTADVGMRDACEYFGFTQRAGDMVSAIRDARITSQNPIIRRLGWLLNEVIVDSSFFFGLRDLSRALDYYSDIYDHFSEETPEGQWHDVGEVSISEQGILDAMIRNSSEHFSLMINNILDKAETEEYAKVKELFPKAKYD